MGDGREGVALIRRVRPDVVLCDIRMPVLDGLGLLAEVTADPTLSAVRVVMLTTFELDEYVFGALKAGASGFLLKDIEPEALIDAVRLVHEGQALLAPQVTGRLIEAYVGGSAEPAPVAQPNPHRAAIAELTQRERDILRLVAAGMSNKEIAEELVLSPLTVKTHVSRVLGKLGARDRAQLVVIAYRNGLLLPDDELPEAPGRSLGA